MNWPHSLRALRSPNFRRYYAGQAVSMIGTWMQSVAVMWLAYTLSGSTWFTGLIGFLNNIPHLFLGPFAGVLGDRINRRTLLLTVLGLMTLQSAVLAILSGLHMITMTQLAALALFAGFCNCFETPTRQSIFVQLLDHREDLPNAIAMNSMLMNGTRLIGPSIGGLLIAAFGETWCFALNSISYLAVLGALLTINITPRPRPPSHPLHDLAEGWRYVTGMLPARRMLATLALVSFSISPYATLMPAVAVKVFGEGAELVGHFIGIVGLGAVIAAVRLAHRSNVRGLGKWVGIGALVAGVGAMGFGLSRTLWVSYPMLMLEGFGMFLTGAAVNTILQSVVDEEKRSRVLSYYTMCFIGSAPLGHYSAGWLADRIGAPSTFVVGGVISIAAGLFFLARIATFRTHLRKVYVSRGIIPSLEDTQVSNP
ncbi:MAG TPA: MFS transporter [Burkholderiales bacterium]|nr:MFS transporter [Burkholderiales bacterium]